MSRRIIKRALPILAGLLALAAVQQGWAGNDIYALTDQTGTVSLSNVPDDPRYLPLGLGAGLQAAALSPAARRSSSTGERGLPAASRDGGSARPYVDLIAQTAGRYGIEPALLHAVISVESAYNPQAVSPRGAAGLMQLMPETARRLGVADVFDPADNVRAGAQYLTELLAMFDNDLRLALAAYNAGEGAVLKYGRRIPPYRETAQYVPKVFDTYQAAVTRRLRPTRTRN